MTIQRFAACLLAGLFIAASVHATERDPPAQPLPPWEQLSQAQRDTLVAPLRERWNRKPEERARMYRRAERWQAMTPEQRARAHRGMQHWERMDPARRAQMRILFESTRDMPKAQRRETMALFRAMLEMPPAEREELRQRWPRMTAVERQQWLREHGTHRGRHRNEPPD
jgi:hypothetical protein